MFLYFFKENIIFFRFQSNSIFLPAPGLNFINVLHIAFTLVDPKSIKNTVKSSVSFYSFGICGRKGCTQNVDEIQPWKKGLGRPAMTTTFINIINHFRFSESSVLWLPNACWTQSTTIALQTEFSAESFSSEFSSRPSSNRTTDDK